MEKQLCLRITPVMLSVVLLASGCKKATDYLKDNPTSAYCPCQIRQFNYAGSSTLGTQNGTKDTVRFTYNAAGDPVTGIRAHPGTGYPNWYFRYDKQGRFTDLIGTYNRVETGAVESWVRWFYDGQGRIVKDSLYTYPAVVNDRPAFDPKYTAVEISLFEYDVKNRVSKESFETGGFIIVTNYTYDAHGNLIGPSSKRVYDDKINYHRTNKIWMFIDKDYSVNNPVTAAYDYNAFGLPISIVPFSGTVQSFLSVAHTAYEFEKATIVYDCQGAL